jgi:site-specific DNA-methyltransferase (adenine-specific)
VKYKRILAHTPKEFDEAKEIIPYLPETCAGRTVDMSTARRRAAGNRKKVQRDTQVIEPLPDDAVRVRHCPFQQLEALEDIAPGSVHLVLTDIPYGKDFLTALPDLSAFAERVLVEGGLFVTLCGQYWLPKVMEALQGRLSYRWSCASVWSGAGTPVHIGTSGQPVISKWKPILVYSKGEPPKRGQWCDVLNIESQEKDWHPMQQPLAEVETLVRYFSEPGDLVIDPCGGGFTTAVACARLNRRCVSCDVDEQCVRNGLARLAEARAGAEPARVAS